MTTVDLRADALQQLLDRDAIRQALMRYARGVDRADEDLICSAYHPDAVDEHATSTYTGLTVGAGIAGQIRRTTSSMHHITNQLIELTGPDSAASEAYYIVWQSQRDQDGVEHVLHSIGRYLDHFERRDGEWKIARRLVMVDMLKMVAPGAAPPPSNVGAGSHDRSDPSYDLFGR